MTIHPVLEQRTPSTPARAFYTLGMLACALTLLAGCSPTITTAALDFGNGDALRFAGLATCSPNQPPVQQIDPDAPLVLLIHGCYSSGGRFRALADVFELHGQQTLCFNYDDRSSLRESAEQLRIGLRGLQRHMRDERVTLVGHSQGGLIARVALSGPPPLEQDDPLPSYRLVTVSSPFAGIRAASDCGSLAMHVLTLGISAWACQIVTGSDWNEIHPRAELVRDPARLWPTVTSHLAVVTDERTSCRHYGPTGGCEKSDFVFDINEQSNPRLLEDPRVTTVQIEAGHVEIVGESGIRPGKLVETLQHHEILAPTPPERRQALRQLLRTLF
jgi:pimeloyl-ACP methyl ester carboxylesterase